MTIAPKHGQGYKYVLLFELGPHQSYLAGHYAFIILPRVSQLPPIFD